MKKIPDKYKATLNHRDTKSQTLTNFQTSDGSQTQKLLHKVKANDHFGKGPTSKPKGFAINLSLTLPQRDPWHFPRVAVHWGHN